MNFSLLGKLKLFFKLSAIVVLMGILVFNFGCFDSEYSENENANKTDLTPVEEIPEDDRTVNQWIVYGARQEVKSEVEYDQSYFDIDYPGGDPPGDRGACTDVVVRALRYVDIDLQKRIHEDMAENFDLYPDNWGLTEPDPNIDHRRVSNQMVYLKRHGKELSANESNILEEYKPGDIVAWDLPGGNKHIGVISDKTNEEGIPLVIHNISGATEEDVLKSWDLIGHYRYPISENGS